MTNGGKGQPLKPDMPTELQCLEETYAKFGVEAKSLQYVECHATGTPQGDAVELECLRKVFGAEVDGTLDPKAFHPKIGSTKGNFGHTLVAAGFAGATKVLLSMNKGVIPATPKLTRPMMPHVLVENCPWPDCSNNGGLKRAGRVGRVAVPLGTQRGA